jgi:hypothetical protein
MKKWVTEFRAIDQKDGYLKTWEGDIVEAPTSQLAQEWCYQNKGHLKVIGELIAEIPCKNGTYEPDLNKMVDYENIRHN